MTFLSPNALWLLLILPLVYLFNVVKHRRLPVPAATLLIWRKVIDKAEAPRSSRKNLFNIALLLELLIVSAFMFALARPVSITETKGRHILVVLDTSASMKAKTKDGKSRFEKALEVLSRIESRLNSKDKLNIVVTVGVLKPGAQPEVTDVAVDMAKIVPRKIAGAAAAGNTVIVITDDPGPLDGILPPDTVIVGVGGTRPNVGIVSAVAKRVKGEDNRFDVFVRMAKTGNIPFPEVEAHGINDGTNKRKIPAEVIRSRGDAVHIRCELQNDSQISITINPPDDSLIADNKVSLWRQGKREITFAIFGNATPSLMRALAAVQAEVITTSGGAPLPEGAIPIYVSETPKPPYPKKFICINPRGNLPGFCSILSGSDAKAAKVESKLSDDVDLRDFPKNPGVIKSIKPEAETETYVSAEFNGERRPLIAKLTRPGETAYVIAFDPENTKWPETAGFPLYWAALAEDLAAEPGDEAVEYRPYRTGLPERGRLLDLIINAEASARFSLLSEDETTTVGKEIPLPAELPPGGKISSARHFEYYTYFILLGILLLLVESGMIMIFTGRAATGRD